MAMFRCGGGSGKIEPITVVVRGEDKGIGGSGATRISTVGIVTLPNLGWTKATCDANRGGSDTVVGSTKVNGKNIQVGASRDITDVESIVLSVESNRTGTNLSGHDKVNATFTLS